MVCKIPDDPEEICYFKGPCEFNEGSLVSSTADLNGWNVCFNLHATYQPQLEGEGRIIPFTIAGQITPHDMNQDQWKKVINYSVSGTRLRGEKHFYVSAGTVEKFAVTKNIRIDAKARPGTKIVDIKVWLPAGALHANKG